MQVEIRSGELDPAAADDLELETLLGEDRGERVAGRLKREGRGFQGLAWFQEVFSLMLDHPEKEKLDKLFGGQIKK